MSVFNVINNFTVAGRILANKFGLSSKFTRSYVWSFHEERLQVDESENKGRGLKHYQNRDQGGVITGGLAFP